MPVLNRSSNVCMQRVIFREMPDTLPLTAFLTVLFCLLSSLNHSFPLNLRGRQQLGQLAEMKHLDFKQVE